MLPRPGRDLLFLGEANDLPLCREEYQHVEDVTGAGRVR